MPVDPAEVPTADDPNEDAFDLLLSGGGFRATLFHLGVIRYLHETDRLQKVRQVFSISGGSILAGFLALNWKSFNDADGFRLAASEVIKYAQSDVRGRLLRRWLASVIVAISLLSGLLSLALFTRSLSIAPILIGVALLCLLGILAWQWRQRALITLFLQSDLRKFLRRVTEPAKKAEAALALKDLPGARSESEPRFTILATDLTTGDPWSFTNEGVWTGSDEAPFIAHDLYPICSAVAASAAFPPLFSPVRFGREIDKNSLKIDHYLADGGVYDNLGIATAVNGPWANLREDRQLVVSNAERRFDNSVDGCFDFLVARAARSSDILMSRVSILHESLGQGVQIRLASESTELSEKFPVSTQRLIRNIRTDLDHFTNEECQLLVFKGYMAAWLALDEAPPPLDDFIYTPHGIPKEPTSNARWLPFRSHELRLTDDVNQVLEDSHRTRLSLQDRHDLRGIGLLTAAILLLILLTPVSWWLARSASRQLPASPTAPSGNWFLAESEKLPEPVDRMRPFLWSYIRPQKQETLSNGIFVSERLTAGGLTEQLCASSMWTSRCCLFGHLRFWPTRTEQHAICRSRWINGICACRSPLAAVAVDSALPLRQRTMTCSTMSRSMIQRRSRP